MSERCKHCGKGILESEGLRLRVFEVDPTKGNEPILDILTIALFMEACNLCRSEFGTQAGLFTSKISLN